MSRTRPRGFTLVEVLVTIFLVAILSAVVVPTVRGRLREGYSSAVMQELDDLASAINAYRQNVGHYPPQLDYLNSLPTASSATDICTNNLTTSQIANYRGPYIARPITANYLIGSSDALVKDVLTRAQNQNIFAAGPLADFLQITVDNVDSLTANDIDNKIDGVKDNIYGTIKWQALGSLTSVTYQIQIKKGTC